MSPRVKMLDAMELGLAVRDLGYLLHDDTVRKAHEELAAGQWLTRPQWVSRLAALERERTGSSPVGQ